MNKFTNTVKAFLNYQRRSVKCNHFPLQVWIEPTSYCNLRCVMCPNDALLPEQKGHMPLERFRKIVDDVYPHVNTVTICDRGEPLLNRDICEMINYAGKRGMTTKISTNGTILNEDKALDLIRSGLSVISFSFDGYGKEKYEKIRVGAEFEKVLNNILGFIRLRNKLKSRTPHVTLQIIEIEDPENGTGKREKERFWNEFQGLKPDRIYIKSAHNWGGSLDQKSCSEPGKSKDKKCYICNSPWYSLVFHWDGRVYPCTLDYKGKYPLGHVDHDSWTDIWNGEKMKQLRMEMKGGNLNGGHHCLKCDKLYEKKFMGISAKNLLNETAFRLRMYLKT